MISQQLNVITCNVIPFRKNFPFRVSFKEVALLKLKRFYTPKILMIMEGLIEGRKNTYNSDTINFERHALAMKRKFVGSRV